MRPVLRALAPVVTAAAVGVILWPAGAGAQLAMSVWRAQSGLVYQVLQHRAGADGGAGVDELRVTSVVANRFGANLCGNPTPSPQDSTAEALASGPLAGLQPLDLSHKSSVVADASPPCFAAAAEDGLGAVCIGPDCAADCSCDAESDCTRFSLAGGVALDTATPDVPAARFAGPLRVVQTHCDVNNEITLAFGGDGDVTTRVDLCQPAPDGGIRLAGTPSSFAGGIAGTTVILVHAATPDEHLHVAAAAFGIDADGANAIGCRSPGGVVGAMHAAADGASVVADEPRPLDRAQLRCLDAIEHATERFSDRAVRVLARCHDRVERGIWDIAPEHCLEHRIVARSLRSAARFSRSRVRARCRDVAIGELPTCGDHIDDLFSPDHTAGCLLEPNLQRALQAAAATQRR